MPTPAILKSTGKIISAKVSSAKSEIKKLVSKKPHVLPAIPKHLILGEGNEGRVIKKNILTVRKEYKPNLKHKVRKLLDGKSAPEREAAIQHILASKGVAPKVKGQGDSHLDMGRIRGKTLSSRLKDSKNNPKKQKQYGKALAKQLLKTHAAGVSHEDLHGGNVIVGHLGGTKILDYGWAKSKGRSLTLKERKKDYKSVLKSHKGDEYKPFRDAFVSTYKP
jgi:predicted Ser/Thr protein kinase